MNAEARNDSAAFAIALMPQREGAQSIELFPHGRNMAHAARETSAANGGLRGSGKNSTRSGVRFARPATR